MTQQFYKLTLEKAIAYYKLGLLTAPALLYFFLKIRLAPGWKMTLHQREISSKLGISKAAYYKAIAKLQQLELIEFEAHNGLTVTLSPMVDSSLPLETQSPIEDSSLQLETRSPNRNSQSPIGDSSLQIETPSLRLETSTSSKSSHSKESSSSSDSYQIFSKSLSDLARENFLNFVREKIKDFPKPINDVEGWLAGKNQAGQYRWRVYYDMFQAEFGETIAPTQDWEKHPQWQQALAAMRTGVPRFIVLGQPGCEDIDEPTRQAMADYAEANNLIWGEES